MTKFSTIPYFIYKRFKCDTNSLSRNCVTIKIYFFSSVSKSFVTYVTIAETNISNNIIKQYYDIIKLFKVLVIVKKTRLISKLSLI